MDDESFVVSFRFFEMAIRSSVVPLRRPFDIDLQEYFKQASHRVLVPLYQILPGALLSAAVIILAHALNDLSSAKFPLLILPIFYTLLLLRAYDLSTLDAQRETIFVIDKLWKQEHIVQFKVQEVLTLCKFFAEKYESTSVYFKDFSFIVLTNVLIVFNFVNASSLPGTLTVVAVIFSGITALAVLKNNWSAVVAE
jgi:hypothetical protein